MHLTDFVDKIIKIVGLTKSFTLPFMLQKTKTSQCQFFPITSRPRYDIHATVNRSFSLPVLAENFPHDLEKNEVKCQIRQDALLTRAMLQLQPVNIQIYF